MMKSRADGFRAPGTELEARVRGLLGKLTLREKIRLLVVNNLKSEGMPKIGLPPIQVSDGPVGVTRSIGFGEASGGTSLPATIGLAASFNEELAYRYGAAVGRDARALGVHIMLGPGVNIYRSALCSRNFEYAGEDPYLAGRTAAGWVRGCQDQAVAVTVKHYVANNQEYDRYFVSSDVSDRALREIYLEAFRIAVQDAGASGIMTSYNRVNGVYASENAYLVQGILKDEWGFDGIVMSDAVSTHNPVPAVLAGLDLELPEGEAFNDANLLPAILDGRIHERHIDEKVRRLLRLAVCFGWFDRDQKDGSIEPSGEESRRTALDVAREAPVLLRNVDGFLPLRPERVQRIVVIGPSADPAVTGGGGSSYVRPATAVSILDGIRAVAEADGIEVVYAKGCDPFRHQHVQQNSRYFTADGREGITAEYFNDKQFRGEPVVTKIEPNLNLIWMRDPPAEGVSKDSFAARWTGVIRPEKDGEHVFTIWGGDGEFRVRVGDEDVFNTWGKGHSGALQRSLALEGGREYEIVAEYRPTWRYNWIRFGWEHVENMWPDHDRALDLAREADAVVFCAGHSRWTESENFDRTFEMPPVARRLLDEVLDASDRVAVVLTGSGNVEMASWIDRSRAVLHAWYPGQEGGTAIGEILLGKVSPSGKLPVTFEARLEDRSSHGSYHDVDGDKRVFYNDGVFSGYRYTDAYGPEPLFPFGFGLSYSSFEYADLELSETRIAAGGRLTASFTIRNTGSMRAAESAQLYLVDVEASVPRPPKELKGYAKVDLDPGEERRLTIEVPERALMFFDSVTDRWLAEPGRFEVLVGASSRDIRLRGGFEYEG
ncbi:MAG: beta-glucosidase H [Spirochaetota bacterium]